ncbi:MAG: glycosyltransferase [Acetatifactor sp.]|nr:glycosyltransferase [Acetatifactor sp.]
MRFSIIVVCLNPGQKLKSTMDSILGQTCRDFEVIIKDGGSKDGSVEPWRKSTGTDGSVEPEGRSMESGGAKVRFFQEKDTGIYDAMNQAVSRAEGEFVLFMNCGDAFYSREVLERTKVFIEVQEAAGVNPDRLVLYGDIYNRKVGARVASAPAITGFTCYRNIPCHQSCIYSTALCREKPFDQQYRIRADYDHFLWCFYRAGVRFVNMGFPVASYEGGGYSESKENKKRNKQEHRLITETYMGKGELFRYRAVMACTLAPLRSAMAESRVFSGVYHWLKGRMYRR